MLQSLTSGPIETSYPPLDNFEYSNPFFIILKLSSLNFTPFMPAFLLRLVISVLSLFILTKSSISIIRLNTLSNISSYCLS